MSSVLLIDPSQDFRWDRFVEEHPYGLISHLSGWKQVLEESFAHIKGYCFALLDEKNECFRAVLPLYFVKSFITGRRLVSIPFATLCDPLAATKEDMQRLLGVATELSTSLNVQRIEIRTLLSTHLIEDRHFERIDFYKHHYLPLNEPPDSLIKRFHRTSVRPIVRRCEQNKLTFAVESTFDGLCTFFNLYVDSRRRLGLPPQPFRFFKNLWSVFGPTGTMRILSAGYEGKTVGSLLVFCYKGRLSAEFIGIDHTYQHLHPSHFLFWNAIKLACAEGLKVFDFGRTSPNNTNLMLSKGRWGTKTTELPEFRFSRDGKPFQNSTENSCLYRIIKNITDRSPRDVAVLLGELCYKHMG